MLVAKIRIVAALLLALALALAGTGMMSRAGLSEDPVAAKKPADAPPVAPAAKPEIGRLAHPEAVADFALAPDGAMLASITTDATVRVWDVAARKELHSWKEVPSTNRVRFSPTGKHLATWALTAKQITVREIAGKLVGTLDRPPNTDSIDAVALAPDALAAASAHWSLDATTASICVWETAAGKVRHTIPGRAPVAALAYSADGKRLAAGRSAFFEKRNGIFLPTAEKMFLGVYDTADGKELHALEADRTDVKAVAFTPDGTQLASTTRRGVVLWELATGNQVWTAADPLTQQSQLVFARDGKALACLAGGPKTIRVLDQATGKVTFTWSGPDGWSLALAFKADGHVMAAGQSLFGRKTLVVWDAHAFGPTGNPDPVKLTRQEWEAAWGQLKSANAGKVHGATITLQHDPERTVGFMRELLAARPRADSPQAPAIIKQLSSDDFQVREKAFAALAALGDGAQSALEKALQDKPTLEVRTRITTLLEKLALSFDRDEQGRWIRMFYVLGQIRTPEARQVLETIANRSNSRYAGLAPDAQRALDRIGPNPEK